MVDIAPGDFNGMKSLWLSNGQVRMAVTTDRGPRIVLWALQDGNNIFAELPDAALDTPNGPLHLLGGHRLWYAPEVIGTTYWPDDLPVAVEQTSNGATFTPPADTIGIVKAINVSFAPDMPEVTVTHSLHNMGGNNVQLAPWAISMCRLGGVALLPQPQGPVDVSGFWPNRHYSFWPYTDINDKRLALGNRISLVYANPGDNNKLGYRNTSGWFGYWLDGTLFTKHIEMNLDGELPDGGCNAEFFFSGNVIELESLSNLVVLAPGEQVNHVEIWRLHPAPSPIQTEDDAVALASALGL